MLLAERCTFGRHILDEGRLDELVFHGELEQFENTAAAAEFAVQVSAEFFHLGLDFVVTHNERCVFSVHEKCLYS